MCGWLALVVGLPHGGLKAEEPEIRVVAVAPAGDDAATGTAEAPVRSLARAVELARSARQQAPDRRVRIELTSGLHRLEEPLRLSAADSGLVIAGPDEGEPAVISGGRAIGGWQRLGKLWQTTVEDVRQNGWQFRELFVDGQRMPRARHPNKGYLRIERAGPDNRTSIFYRAGELTKLPRRYEGVELVFLHDWSISRIPVASIDPSTRELRVAYPIGCNAPHYAITHFEPNPRFYLENAPEFMDAEGEWYLDGKTGRLSLYSSRERPPQAIAPALTQLLVIDGGADDPEAAPPRFGLRNLEFAHCRFDLPEQGYAEGQATFHEPRSGEGGSFVRHMVPPAVEIHHASVHVKNCRFSQLGGNGLWLHRGVQGAFVEGCVFEDISGNGLMIGETQARIPPGGAADDRTLVTQGVKVRECEITRCGQQFYGAVGVWIGMAADCVVEACHIHKLPYTGVSLGWRWNDSPSPSGGHQIVNNHIHDIMQKLSDGGGIYTLGRQPGTVLAENRIHGIPVNLGRAESNGMFLDEGSSEILVKNNTIYGTERASIRFHRAHSITLEGNTLTTPEGIEPFRYNNSRAETMTFIDNTLKHDDD